MVWIFDPDAKSVEVYVSGQPVKVLQGDAALDGGDLLPGFQVKVADVFPEENTA